MDQNEYLKKANELYDLIEKVHDKKITLWLDHVLFTWQWWLGVFLAVVPWILWFVFRKKGSTHRLLYAGFSVIMVSSWLDFVGIALGLWHYNYDVLPLLPSYLPWDFTIIPVIIMFLIQIKPDSHPFIKALIFAAGSAFIGEPFFSWIKTYTPENWKYIYSFPFFICIYLLGHFLSKRGGFNKITEKKTDQKQ
jgi:xanthine/uracil permease